MTTEYIPGVDAPDDPWVQLWQKVWDEHGTDGELTNYRIYGMSHAYAFVQALQAAGEDLTREGLVDARRGGRAATSRARSSRPSATPPTATWASPACGWSRSRTGRASR